MEPIYSYSRKQAIEDGVLVDVTATAKECGFRFPVALTQAVWAEYVVVPDGVEAQDERGRLWDMLFCLHVAIKKSKGDGPELLFTVLVRNDNRGPKKVRLKSVCGPGDQMEPVITVMMVDED